MRWIYITLSLLVAACSITSPRDVGKANMLSLSVPADLPAIAHRQGALRINYPTLPSSLDTYRIAVTKADGRQDYIAAARWSEFLPSVVQASLQEAFSQSQAFSYVGTDEGGVASNYVLNTEILDFRVVYPQKNMPPEIILDIMFQLKATNSKGSLSKARIQKHVMAKNNSLSAIASAFNIAFAEVLDDMFNGLVRKHI